MRPHPSRPRASAVVPFGLALATALAALTACGQPGSPTPPVPTTVDVAIQPTIAPVGPSAPDTDALDPSAAVSEDLYDASDALSDARCEPQGDSWSFSGTLTNTQAGPETYTVGITLLKVSDLSEVVTKEVTVTVPPGQHVPVEAKDFHTGPAAGLRCLTGVTVKES